MLKGEEKGNGLYFERIEDCKAMFCRVEIVYESTELIVHESMELLIRCSRRIEAKRQ